MESSNTWSNNKRLGERDTCTHFLESIGALIIGEAPGEFGVDVDVLVEVVLELYAVGLSLAMYEVTQGKRARAEEHERVAQLGHCCMELHTTTLMFIVYVVQCPLVFIAPTTNVDGGPYICTCT